MYQPVRTAPDLEWCPDGLPDMDLQDEVIPDGGNTKGCEDREGHIGEIIVDNNNLKRTKQGEDDSQE